MKSAGWNQTKRGHQEASKGISRSRQPYSEDYKNRKTLEFVEVVETHGQNGLSHKRAADLMDMDRKTLRKYSRKAIRLGHIKRQSGWHGKYYPNTDWSKEIDRKTEKLVNYIQSTVLQTTGIAKLSPSKINAIQQSESEDIVRIIFELSNAIGACSSYMIIQSMNPQNYDLATDMNGEDHKYVERWIKTGLSFLDIRAIRNFKEKIKQKISGDESDYRLDVHGFEALSTAFRKLYPNVYKRLEFARIELPEELKLIQMDEKRRMKNLAAHKACIRDYGKHHYADAKLWVRSEDGKKGKFIRTCIRCKFRTIYVDEIDPKIIEDNLSSVG